MEPRERLLRVFKQQEVDRIPVAPFIHTNFVNEFCKGADIDIIAKTIEVYEHFGFDLLHRNCTPVYDDINLEGYNWTVDKNITMEGRNQTTVTKIETPAGNLQERFKLVWISNYDAEASAVEYFIKAPQDFDILERYQPPVGTIDTSDIKRAKKLVGGKGIIAPWVQGTFNHCAFYYRRLDDLLMDAMTNPKFYHRMMEYFLQRNKQMISQFMDAGVDALSYGANIASGKLISEDFFREYVFPYEKKLIDFIKSSGVYVQYHNCGYGMKLLPAYCELEMNVYESLTPPPFGDTIFEKALEIMPKSITLSGNIDQIEFLKTASPEEIRMRVREILEKAKRRGNFLLSTTDYFDEQTPPENILAFAEAGVTYGLY
jgi:uroporphyrinogen decarboxylase